MDATDNAAKRARIMAIIGMAMLWPSVHNQLMYPVTFTFNKELAPSPYILYFVYVLMMAITIAFIFIGRRHIAEKLFANRIAIAAIAGAGAIGNLFVILCDFQTSLSAFLAALGLALVAIYVPIHFIFWGTRLANASPHVATDTAVSYVIFCVVMGVRLFFGVHAWSISLLFIVIAGVLSYFAASLPPRTSLEKRGTIKLLPLSIIIPSIVFVYLSLSLLHPFTPIEATSEYPPNRALLYVVNAVLLTIAAVLFQHTEHGGGKARVRLFVLLCAYLSITFLLTGLSAASDDVISLGNFPIIAGKNAFECFIWIVLLFTAQRKKLDLITPASVYLLVVVMLPDLIRAILAMVGSGSGVSANAFVLLVGTVVSAFIVSIVANVILMLLFVRPGKTTQSEATSEENATARFLAEFKATFDLSDREMDIVQLAYQDKSAKKIAEELFIAESTVYTHLKRIYRKVDVHSKQELIALINTIKDDESEVSLRKNLF